MEIKLGKRWQEARATTDLTQEKASEKIGRGSRYVSDLEREKSVGSIPELIKLCNLYNVTPTLILQDYLNIKEDLKFPVELVKYKKLSEKDKAIVISLINQLSS